MGEEKETGEVGDDTVSHALRRIFYTRKVAFFEKRIASRWDTQIGMADSSKKG